MTRARDLYRAHPVRHFFPRTIGEGTQPPRQLRSEKTLLREGLSSLSSVKGHSVTSALDDLRSVRTGPHPLAAHTQKPFTFVPLTSSPSEPPAPRCPASDFPCALSCRSAQSQPVPREDWPPALLAKDVVMPRPSRPSGRAVVLI